MALNLNKVIIAGRLCADPEVKTTQSGLSVVTVRVAVNRRTKSGEHPEADFFTVTAWRQTAEFIGKYFRKGSAICVVGSLTVRTWEDRDGNRRQSTEIVADEALFAESKQDGSQVGAQPAAAPQAPADSQGVNPHYSAVPGTPDGMAFEQIGEDDDLPF